MQITPIGQTYEMFLKSLFYQENLLLTVLKWYFKFQKILAIGLNSLEAKMQKL
jgi:hypothetical protein